MHKAPYSPTVPDAFLAWAAESLVMERARSEFSAISLIVLLISSEEEDTKNAENWSFRMNRNKVRHQKIRGVHH